MSKPKALFRFHTVSILESDVALTKAPNWLNDSLIHFAFEFFQHVIFNPAAGSASASSASASSSSASSSSESGAGAGASSSSTSSISSFLSKECMYGGSGGEKQLPFPIKFIPPGTSFVMCHEDDADDFADIVRAHITTRDGLIFFPINNNQHITQAGGSHWTLLVWDGVFSKTFYYFDSSAGQGRADIGVPCALADKLYPFVKPGGGGGAGGRGGGGGGGAEREDKKDDSGEQEGVEEGGAEEEEEEEPEPAPFKVVASPQQMDSHNCGTYVIATASTIAHFMIQFAKSAKQQQQGAGAAAAAAAGAKDGSKTASPTASSSSSSSSSSSLGGGGAGASSSSAAAAGSESKEGASSASTAPSSSFPGGNATSASAAAHAAAAAFPFDSSAFKSTLKRVLSQAAMAETRLWLAETIRHVEKQQQQQQQS